MVEESKPRPAEDVFREMMGEIAKHEPGIFRRLWIRVQCHFVGAKIAARHVRHSLAKVAWAESVVERHRAEIENLASQLKAARREAEAALLTVEDREREIKALEVKDAQKTSTIAIREQELKDMADWMERARARIKADIALEVARESRAGAPQKSEAGG